MSVVIAATPQIPFTKNLNVASPIQLNGSNTPSCLSASINWADAVARHQFAVAQTYGVVINIPNNVMDRVLGVFVDNSENTSPVVLYFPDTGFQLEVPEYSQVTSPVVTNGTQCVVYGNYYIVSLLTAAAGPWPSITNLSFFNSTTFYSERNLLQGPRGVSRSLLAITNEVSTIAITSYNANIPPNSLIKSLNFSCTFMQSAVTTGIIVTLADTPDNTHFILWQQRFYIVEVSGITTIVNVANYDVSLDTIHYGGYNIDPANGSCYLNVQWVNANPNNECLISMMIYYRQMNGINQ